MLVEETIGILRAIEKSTFYVNLIFGLVSVSSLIVVGGYGIAPYIYIYIYCNNINTTYVGNCSFKIK